MYEERSKYWWLKYVLAFLATIGVLTFVLSIRIVDQTEACAITRLGKVVGEARTGFQLVTPLVTSLDCYPTAAVLFQTGTEQNKAADYWDVPVEIKSQDGQTGDVMFNILFAIDPQYAAYIRSNVARNRNDLKERVVANFARSVPRDVASGFTADGLYAVDRAEYQAKVREILADKYAPFGVRLIAFELRDVQFSEAYENSIEQQQIAEEQIETATFVTEQKKQEAEQARIAAQGAADASVIQAKADAESKILEATAEAEANRLVSQSLTTNLLQYEYIKQLSGTSTIFLPSDQEFILPLPGTP